MCFILLNLHAKEELSPCIQGGITLSDLLFNSCRVTVFEGAPVKFAGGAFIYLTAQCHYRSFWR